MKPIVLYSTRSGNTKKVAEAISSELNCPCLRITSDSLTGSINDYDTVFIGTGIYKGQPHQDLLNTSKQCVLTVKSSLRYSSLALAGAKTSLTKTSSTH